MLAIDGYGSLYRFYLAAKKAIQDRVPLPYSFSEEPQPEVFSWDAYRENVDIAAKYLVRNVLSDRINKGDTFPCILNKDGTLITLSTFLLTVTEGFALENSAFLDAKDKAKADGLVLNGEYIFGLKSLTSDYWHAPFISERIFTDSSLVLDDVLYPYGRGMPLIDWRSGTVSLKRLRALHEAIEAMRISTSAFEKAGIQVDQFDAREIIAAYDESDAPNLLNMLAPYDGCTIVAPIEWIGELNGSEEEALNEPADNLFSGAPKSAILSLLKAQPTLTKSGVKAKLFPKTSTRRFNMHWQQAAEENPALAKPGRRKEKS